MKHPWVIGGPSRCGKSSLALALSQSDNDHAVLQVDALLHRNRKRLCSQKETQEFIRKYLERPRYMDAECKIQRTPLDDFESNIETIATEIRKKKIDTQLGAINELLKIMAKQKNKKNWVALDLHPEFYFEEYKKIIPELKLLVVNRDPKEAIAAYLYWRTYPNRVKSASRLLRYKLFLWCLSQQKTQQLIKKYQSDIKTVTLQQMLNETSELPKSFKGNKVKDTCGAIPYFSYNAKKGFYMPDGTWKHVLNKNEIMLINMVSGKRIEPESGISKILGSYVLIKSALLFARVFPLYTKAVFDISLFPLVNVKRLRDKVKAILRPVFIKATT